MSEDEKSLKEELEEVGERIFEEHPLATATVGYGALFVVAAAFSWFFSRSCIVSAIRRAR